MRARHLLIAVFCGLALTAPAGSSAYPWPVKPFNKQHPVRANFGDPRTRYLLGFFQGGMEGPGSFQFHNGIDIAAPDGTDVFPVMSGLVKLLDTESLAVTTSQGRTFQYFHIIPQVMNGQYVYAKRTLLGYIKRGAGHVHLTEIRGFKVWNPLAKGGIAPYHDRTRPTVADILIRRPHSLEELDPLGVCGHVALAANAFDTPPMRVRGTFANFPVSPAVVTWSLRRVGTTTLIARPSLAADFRGTLPVEPQFWDVYARGTYQNAPRFAQRQFELMPGRYLYNLTDSLDTRKMANGVYQISVRATDIKGNSRTLSERFTVVNQNTATGCPGAPPPPPPPPPTTTTTTTTTTTGG